MAMISGHNADMPFREMSGTNSKKLIQRLFRRQSEILCGFPYHTRALCYASAGNLCM